MQSYRRSLADFDAFITVYAHHEVCAQRSALTERIHMTCEEYRYREKRSQNQYKILTH